VIRRIPGQTRHCPFIWAICTRRISGVDALRCSPLQFAAEFRVCMVKNLYHRPVHKRQSDRQQFALYHAVMERCDPGQASRSGITSTASEITCETSKRRQRLEAHLPPLRSGRLALNRFGLISLGLTVSARTGGRSRQPFAFGCCQ